MHAEKGEKESKGRNEKRVHGLSLQALSAQMKKDAKRSTKSEANPTPSLFLDEEKEREYHLKLIDNAVVASLEALKCVR